VKHLYTKALLGGALISVVPAFIVTLLSNILPATQSQNLEVVNDIFSVETYGILQYFMLFSIIVLSPVVEEVIFRGVLWNFMKKFLKEKTVYIVISVLFAVIHMDLLHVLGLLPVSFLLGWFKYKTGNIKASLVCHISNNLVACIIMMV
tara:strand:+ start:76 stop:522 length:447 start_codon:yes stop_codon:yes gene_type:complete